MNLFLRIIKHLLPTGRAWRLTVDKRLRQFFDGLSGTGTDAREFIDLAYLDLLPEYTRELSAWEDQFALQDTGLTDQQRRDRLDAAWKARGGQSPGYIQGVLQDNGFPVYVHEWWVPGTEPAVGSHAAATPRSPLVYLRREYSGVIIYQTECGEVGAECGEAQMECGNNVSGLGYPLVNKLTTTVPDILPLCGEEGIECGEADALCGNYTQFVDVVKNYIVPLDPATWPYFLYIGGQVFGTQAQVPEARRDEFEDLCLKICPAQQWLGIIVEYT